MRSLACMLLAAPLALPAQQHWTVERVPITAVPMSTADDEPQFAAAAFATRLANGAVALFTGIAPRRDAPGGPPRQTPDGRQYQIGSVGATVLVVDADGETTPQVSGVTYGEMLMGQLTPGE